MRVLIETLGCKVNFYESEVIKNLFIKNGDEIVSDNADVVVINTCSVTNQSDAKDRKIIRKSKKNNPNAIIVVCGCYSQHATDLIDILPIDILLGNKDKTKIIDYINEYLKTKEKIVKIYDLTNTSFEDMEIDNNYERTRAYVKIEDGCDNYCSYCIIPYVRGNVRYKDYDKAYNEIKKLVEMGYKEIVLTGIHTGRYPKLVSLIHDISLLDGLKRIRISSIEITEINNEEFLNELKINPKLCNQMHIPIQSACDNTLRMMNRKYNVKEFIDIINKLKSVREDINITTDLIVGFPSETSEDFDISLENARKIGFGKIHVFPYSKRDGTAASKMKNVVSDKDKDERTHKMLLLSNELETNYYNKFLNKELKVLIEEVSDNESYGYTDNYIRVKINQKLKHNEFYNVTITEVDSGIAIGIVK